MSVADFDFALPAELVRRQPFRAGSRGCSCWIGAADHLEHRGFATCLTFSGRATCWSPTTHVCSRRACSATACPLAAPWSVCCCRPCDAGSKPTESAARRWDALMHPGQKLKPGARVRFERRRRALDGEVLERQFFGRRRDSALGAPTRDASRTRVDAIGHMPLPPYIHRDDTRGRSRALPDGFRARRADRSRRQRPACTSTPRLLERARRARRRARDDHAARRLRHVQAGPRRATSRSTTVDPEPFEIVAAAAAAIERARSTKAAA